MDSGRVSPEPIKAHDNWHKGLTNNEDETYSYKSSKAAESVKLTRPTSGTFTDKDGVALFKFAALPPVTVQNPVFRPAHQPICQDNSFLEEDRDILDGDSKLVSTQRLDEIGRRSALPGIGAGSGKPSRTLGDGDNLSPAPTHEVVDELPASVLQISLSNRYSDTRHRPFIPLWRNGDRLYRDSDCTDLALHIVRGPPPPMQPCYSSSSHSPASSIGGGQIRRRRSGSDGDTASSSTRSGIRSEQSFCDRVNQAVYDRCGQRAAKYFNTLREWSSFTAAQVAGSKVAKACATSILTLGSGFYAMALTGSLFVTNRVIHWIPKDMTIINGTLGAAVTGPVFDRAAYDATCGEDARFGRYCLYDESNASIPRLLGAVSLAVMTVYFAKRAFKNIKSVFSKEQHHPFYQYDDEEVSLKERCKAFVRQLPLVGRCRCLKRLLQPESDAQFPDQ